MHVLLVFLNPGSQIQVSVLLTLKQSAFTPHVRFLSQLGNPKKLRKIYRDYCVKTSLLIVIDYFNKYIIYNVHCSSKNNVLVGRRNIYIYIAKVFPIQVINLHGNRRRQTRPKMICKQN